VPNINLSSLFLAKRRAITFALAAGLGVLVLASGAGVPLDHQLRSLRDGLRSHAASGEVHVVEIDARSLDSLDRWPLPRGFHAAAIDRLRAAGARTIAFDVDFSTVSAPAEDARMEAALRRAGGAVILPTLRQEAGGGSSESIESAPIKRFSDNAFLGAVNVVPDPDSYVRRMLLGVETFGVPRPSLPSLLAETNAVIGQSFDIDYSIDPKSLPRHSLIDLLEGKVARAEIAGKRVLIGGTAIDMGDRYPVPNHGVIPGVIIQALAAETLLAGRVPEAWSGLLPLFLSLLLIALALRPGSYGRRIGLFAIGNMLMLCLPLVTEALFAISFPLASAFAASVAASLLGASALLIQRNQERALTDSETGLPNFRSLHAALVKSGSLNIVVARIDRFAGIASGLGSEATTKLVLRIAERLKFANDDREIYRTDDSSLAWLEPPADEVSLEDRIDAIAAVMRAPVECGRFVDVSLTFGLAPGIGEDAKQGVTNAALAALHASQRGARWEKFTDADSDEADWHLSLLGDLETAMASGQLWNAYQPKLDLRSSEVIGVEALVRWHHPERGPIQPDSFIPMLEEHGRARDLTTHVLGQALEDALHWEELGHPIGVAVNVSASLLADHEFIELVGQILQGSRLPTSRVTVEVTETAAMHSPDRAIAALESWRALGLNISIDDYGTGQSSLNYLQKLPATELKIDKMFVQTIGSDRRNAIMVRSTVALAHELGMKVVAEGIEDAACLQILAEMGCDTGQGYFVGRPMSADAIGSFLGERQREAA
jgi:EAL domain-containing protein (putative c-di-GMP-specific phosphodiesterase class I)/CHASE2 domain-containing sensor protein